MLTLRLLTLVFALIYLNISFATRGQSGPSQPYATEWKRTLEPEALGQGDLDAAYNDVLDFLLPRQPVQSNSCYAVIRYERVGEPQKQLNVIVGDESTSIWRLELSRDVSTLLYSSNMAGAVASSISTSSTHFLQPDKDRFRMQLRRGVPVGLSDSIAIHGDRYRVWGKCGLGSVYVEQVVVHGRSAPIAIWANQLWAEARKTGKKGSA